MKKMYLKKFTAIFVTLVLVFALLPSAALAVTEPADNTLSICINNSGMEVGSLDISESAFVFNDIPDGRDSAIFQISNSTGELVARDYGIVAEDRSIWFPMQRLPEGDYELALWFRMVDEEERDHYLHGAAITVSKTTQGWQLKNGLAYAQNTGLAWKERTDRKALEWFLKPSDCVQSDDPEIIALAHNITAGIDNAYDKVLAIHDWVCGNIYYDYDYFYGHSDRIDVKATGVLAAGKTVCAGYSNLFAALCRAAGVPAKVVSGFAKNPALKAAYPEEVFTQGETNHAWNEVFADGRWIVIDTTWDSGNSFENGVKTKSLGVEHHKYFDPGQEWFSQSHVLVNVGDVEEYTFYIGYPKMYERSNGSWHDYSDDGAVPYLENGRTLIPLWTVVRCLHGTLTWNEESFPGWTALDCQIPGHQATVFLGYSKFFVDGEIYSFEHEPQLIDGHVRVEVRALFSALGCEVSWDGRGEWASGAVTVSCEAWIRL